MDLGFFPAFFDHPQRIRFDQQEDDEEIELFLRRHVATNTPWVLASIFFFALPFLIVLGDIAFQFGITTNLPPQIGAGLIIIWYMLVAAYVIENFLFWYFNIYIITNKNLVDINYTSLLSRSVVEVKIEDVQSQKSKIQGILRQIFNFGNVVVETAAENQRIDFEDVPKPDLVADRIQDLKTRYADRNEP